MLKLVSAEVPSLEGFMKQYNASGLPYKTSRYRLLLTLCYRWTIPPLFTALKWAYLRRLNTQQNRGPRPPSGLRKPHK